jgi:hypothetical protein
VNVDEFEHTEVEQQARRDQQRVLAAMARRDPEVQREGNDATQAAFQSPTAHDTATAGSPPTHPAQLSDGGGTDVGGVGSQQTPGHRHRDKPPNREPGKHHACRWCRRLWRDGTDDTATAEDNQRQLVAAASTGVS